MISDKTDQTGFQTELVVTQVSAQNWSPVLQTAQTGLLQKPILSFDLTCLNSHGFTWALFDVCYPTHVASLLIVRHTYTQGKI
jgi:hypothetical protein